MKLIKNIIILLVLSCSTKLHSQDLRFSQFMNSPLITNPANTGFIPDADYRIGGHYRSQWTSVPVPYKTYSLFADAQLFRNRIDNGWMGLGGLLLRDVAGSGNLTSTKAYASIAYHQQLGFSSLISAGANVGFVNKRIDLSKFTWDNQWNGKFFDAGSLSGENFGRVNPNISYLDVQIGLNYAYFPNENTYINTGVSIMHVNSPNESFFSDTVRNNQLARRYTAFLNGSFKITDNVIFNPNAYYSLQAKSTELVAGANVQYNLSQAGEKQFVVGAYYRLNDAAVFMAGFILNSLRFTFTFDATTSSLRNFNGSRGATEFSLINYGFYDTYKGDRKQSFCPKF